jgi:hypothetical protein
MKDWKKQYWKEVEKLQDDTGYFYHSFVLDFITNLLIKKGLEDFKIVLEEKAKQRQSFIELVESKRVGEASEDDFSDGCDFEEEMSFREGMNAVVEDLLKELKEL